MTSALLVEDDARLAALLVEFLGKHEVEVATCARGEDALASLARRPVDVVLLDLMLPGIDGLEVCRRIRARPELAATPVIMLTAKGDDVDKIVGLELGADDYLAKPFNPRELLARIRAVRRRMTAAPASSVRVGEIALDLAAREVTRADKRVVLTTYEFDLLALLARTPGRVLTRERIFQELRGDDFDVFDRSIDVHIAKLRQKLEDNPKAPRLIKTVRGVGYVLARPGDE